MDMAQLEQDINAAWEDRDSISAATTGAVRDAVNAALGMLDNGSARVAEPRGDHQWHVNQWTKKGRSAVIPAERHGGDPVRHELSGKRRGVLVGQGAV